VPLLAGGLARYDHPTFEEYCEQWWEMSDRHARYLIDAAAFATLIQRNHSSVPIPARETHIRPLLSASNSMTTVSRCGAMCLPQ